MIEVRKKHFPYLRRTNGRPGYRIYAVIQDGRLVRHWSTKRKAERHKRQLECACSSDVRERTRDERM